MKTFDLKNSYVKEIVLNGIPGSNVEDMANEVFIWFYNQKDVTKVTCSINGAKMTLERTGS